jgi:D-arabinose 1-dehydrogenase-like Zn-dependent alcohol dehydrogenase
LFLAMRAMVLRRAGERLAIDDRPDPAPGPGEIRIRVEACGVCRTDLHVVDGDLPDPKLPIVPGHEIVGRVEAVGDGVALKPGARVGAPWLGHACGHCPYCLSAHENLCDAPLFTGYTRDGGFATHVVADAAFVFPLTGDLDPVAAAPLLCAGLIGWRSLKAAGANVRKGGRVVCGGIHMSDLPSFPYRLLWEERSVVSVANLTRADGEEFLALAPRVPVRTITTPYPLEKANEALDDLRAGRLEGAAVLVP